VPGTRERAAQHAVHPVLRGDDDRVHRLRPHVGAHRARTGQGHRRPEGEARRVHLRARRAGEAGTAEPGGGTHPRAGPAREPRAARSHPGTRKSRRPVSMEGMKHIRVRANVVYLMLVLFGLAIAVKLFTIQLVEGDKWLAKAGTVATAWRTVVPERGNIFSEDGRMLATSVPVYDVYMDMLAGGLTEPLFSDSLPQLAECLASVFPDRSATDRRRALAD